MTNSKNYDSAFCGSLPIHQINLVQPHGLLIVLDKSFKIVQVSENVDGLLGRERAHIINTSIADYIPSHQFNLLVEHSNSGIRKIPLRFSFSSEAGTTETTALVNVQNALLIIELELLPANSESMSAFTDVYQRLKLAMAAVEAAGNTEEVCNAALAELKKISGFDKIMIYQFDEDWNGKVIAEKMEPGMDSYLGLVFPASDIPKQARQLYQHNAYRLIPNVDYTPVKLYPLINPVTNGFLDLSETGIRAVPAVHLEYMRNMGIKASMSTRILNADHTLWGLISCHHLQPKFLNYEVCTIFELMSTIISTKIASVQSQEHFSLLSGLQDLQSQLLKQIYSENDLVRGLMTNDKTLLQLVNADGVVVYYNKRFGKAGETPSKGEVDDLILWLKSLDISKVYHEETLSSLYEGAASFSGAGSGLLAIPIQPAKGDFILFFRQEAKRKINWGGNPGEAIQFEKNSMTYHPRNSFNLWQQTVADTSLPWKPYEINVAEQFRNFVFEFIVKNDLGTAAS